MKYTDNEQAAILAVGDAGEQGLPHGAINSHIRNRLALKKQLLGRIRADGRVRLTARGRKVYERLRGSPAGWEVVEVFGHSRHVGRTREVKELGKTFLRVDVPAYVHDRRSYSARTFKLAPGSIFRRTELTEPEARRQLGYQTNTGEGTPLPGLRLEEARGRIGGYSLRASKAAELLGLEHDEYESLERCTAELSESRCDQLIRDLTAAWAKYLADNGGKPPQPQAPDPFPGDEDDCDDEDEDRDDDYDRDGGEG